MKKYLTYNYEQGKKAKKRLKYDQDYSAKEILRELIDWMNSKAPADFSTQLQAMCRKEPPRPKHEMDYLKGEGEWLVEVREKIIDAFFANPRTRHIPIKCSKYSRDYARLALMVDLLIEGCIPMQYLIRGDSRLFTGTFKINGKDENVSEPEMKRNRYQYRRAKKAHEEYVQNYSLGRYRKKIYLLRALARDDSFFDMLGFRFLTHRHRWEGYSMSVENYSGREWMPLVDLYHEQMRKWEFPYDDLLFRPLAMFHIPDSMVENLDLEKAEMANLKLKHSIGADSPYWVTNDDSHRYNARYGNLCMTCGKVGNSRNKMKACAKCKTAFYCSKECQQKDWKDHKKYCKLWRSSSLNDLKKMFKPKGLPYSSLIL